MSFVLMADCDWLALVYVDGTETKLDFDRREVPASCSTYTEENKNAFDTTHIPFVDYWVGWEVLEL